MGEWASIWGPPESDLRGWMLQLMGREQRGSQRGEGTLECFAGAATRVDAARVAPVGRAVNGYRMNLL